MSLPWLDRPIFLIGFMAAGKSAAGERLAATLGWSFVDIDVLVEQWEQRSIQRIFEESGEKHFRRVEAETLRELGDAPRSVVATGGGLFLGFSQRRWMAGRGTTVWLDVPLEEARRRLSLAGEASGGRPMWRPDDPLALRAFYERRRAVYALARIRVDATSGGAEQVAESIRRAVERSRRPYLKFSVDSVG